MEIANLRVRMRAAEESDLPHIAALMHNTHFNHIHVDWRLPRHWLGGDGFVVAETTSEHHLGDGVMLGCLALGADPPPGAWVRMAAVRGERNAVPLLNAMLRRAAAYIAACGVDEIGWLPRGRWPQEWMEALGFERVDEVVTYVKGELEVPATIRHNAGIIIRDVRAADMPTLAAIEHAAFEPLWRHSVESLTLGWRHALSFHVAELGGRLVGFQYSSDSDVENAGHLVRLTVSPDVQRSGVGSALLIAALESYRWHNLSEASLNTQLSNAPSRRLYEKFGYRPAGYHWPVWSRRFTYEEAAI